MSWDSSLIKSKSIWKLISALTSASWDYLFSVKSSLTLIGPCVSLTRAYRVEVAQTIGSCTSSCEINWRSVALSKAFVQICYTVFSTHIALSVWIILIKIVKAFLAILLHVRHCSETQNEDFDHLLIKRSIWCALFLILEFIIFELRVFN